jgi:RNA polymerase sigma factor (sigma-70 family)
MDNEYRIDIKVRNNIVLSRIEKAGYISIPVFCKSNNITYGTFLKIINMTRSVFNTDGQWNINVIKAADALKCSPENLFSEAQLNAVIKSNKRTLQVNEAEMRFMIENDNIQKLPETLYLENQMENAIENTLETLTSREQKVIQMKTGLGDYSREYTYNEIGQVLGISIERTRQIHQKALRKLRHPSRAESLREFIENE